MLYQKNHVIKYSFRMLMKNRHPGVGQAKKAKAQSRIYVAFYIQSRLKHVAISMFANSINFICFSLLKEIKISKNTCW